MDDMKRIIKAALFTPTSKGWGLPMMFWGDPGVVKSDMVRQVAADYGFHLEVLSPGERGEGAFGVTPMPEKKPSGGYFMTYPEPDWVLDIERHDGRGIVFVDEIPHAPPAVQPALLGLALDRRIGASYLGAGVRVLAAGNPPGEGSGGYEMTAAAANRFCHINWTAPSLDEWSDWMHAIDPRNPLPQAVESQYNIDNEERRVLKAWPRAFDNARTSITTFLRFKRLWMHKKPAADSPDLARAWPSRRTWTMATYALASSVVHGVQDLETHLLGGFVGSGAAEEFLVYRANLNLPKAEDVLDGRTGFEHDPLRLDITYAILSSCSLLVADPECHDRKKRLVSFWRVLRGVIDAGVPDIAMQAARKVARSPSSNGYRPTDGSTAQSVLASLRPTMEAAGFVL